MKNPGLERRTRPLLAPVWCGWPTWRSAFTRRCPAPAGADTSHPGYGPCSVHEPRSMKIAWRHAMDAADRLGVSPWDALLLAVDLSVRHTMQSERDLKEIRQANDGNPVAEPVIKASQENRQQRKLMSITARDAINSGIAERLVRQREFEGRVLADALEAALAAVELTDDQRIAAMQAAHSHLLAIEPAPTTILDPPGGGA